MSKEKAVEKKAVEKPQEPPALESSKELVKQEEALPMVEEAEELGDLFAQNAGAGLANIGVKDTAIPFFAILQKNSPAVDIALPSYIEGAKAGMIVNNVTGELYNTENEGVDFIHCAFEKRLVRWKDRDTGGGFVGNVEYNDPIVTTAKPDARKRLVFPDGDLLIETAYHYVILVHRDPTRMPEYGVIPMASTQHKASRLWNKTLKELIDVDKNNRAYPAPGFSRIYTLTTAIQTKDKYSWHGWIINLKKKLDSLILAKMAMAYCKSVEGNLIQLSEPQDGVLDIGGEQSDAADVPF